MRKKIFTVLIFILGSIKFAQGQRISLLSFEGTNESICVLPDDNKKILSISYLQDTLHIEGFININSLKILSKSLLKIDYTIRSGTGMHMQRTVILAVNHKILCQLLHITSLFDEEFIDFSKKHISSDTPDVISHYKVVLNLTGNDSRNFKFEGKVRDEKKSKNNHQTDYKRDYEVSLNLDTNVNVFYNKYQVISAYYTVYDPKSRNETKRYFMGTFPSVTLGKSEYYYVKGEWYEKDDYNNLSKLAYK
jgi:hypothetical protein